MSLLVYLILLSMMFSRSIHDTANDRISFFFMPYSPLYTYHVFPIHLSVDGHLGCFNILGTINSDSTKLFQKIEEYGTLQNLFYKPVITLIPKSEKDTPKEKKKIGQ